VADLTARLEQYELDLGLAAVALSAASNEILRMQIEADAAAALARQQAETIGQLELELSTLRQPRDKKTGRFQAKMEMR
jgi:hypothetical protein